MTLTAAFWIAYIILNLFLSIYHTRKDYKKGKDVTLMHLIYILTFGWWYSIPSLLYTWLMERYVDFIDALDNRVIFKAK